MKLRIEGLVVEARGVSGEWFRIVDGVSFDVSLGEVVALIGESGAGKTTVALAALGYQRPGTRIIQGQVFLGDLDILAHNRKQLRKIRGIQVAYVAQSAAAAFNPAITLGQQVAEGFLIHRVSEVHSVRKRVVDLLQLLDLPNPDSIAKRYPHQVSGGQQQRFMMAMAMSCMPKFLVLDEPTTGLDVTTQIEVLKAVKDVILQKGSGAIYVSHDLAVVTQVADRILVMRDGKTVEKGTTENILNKPRKEYTRQLLKAVHVVPNYSEDFTKNNHRRTEDTRLILELKDMRATYDKGTWLHPIPEEKHILRGVSFYVKSWEVVALVGESGSGKSTIAKVIAGLLPPVSGQVQFKGRQLASSVRRRPLELLRMIQMVCQSPDTTLNPSRDISSAIGRPLEFYFGFKGKARRRRVERLLTMVELPPEYADRYPSELSGGERQRVSLARAFGANPEVILCDEVLSSLDTVVGAAVLDLLRDLQKRIGVAYLFISHDLATVATIADRVVVLYAGRVCEEGPTEKVFSPPYHPYTALLISSVPELRQGWLEDIVSSRTAAKGIVHGGLAPMDRACAFRTRCPFSIKDLCHRKTPTAKKVAEDHFIYCYCDVDELMESETKGTLVCRKRKTSIEVTECMS